jgi:hypothetical protein
MSIAPGLLIPSRELPWTKINFEVPTNQSWPHALESSMDFDSVGEIIATRRLYFFDEGNRQRTVSVFVGKPEQSHGSAEYHCPVQVIGIGSQQTQLASGHDSIQALQSAFKLIAANLDQLNSELGGKLVWEASCNGDLGFP